MLAPYWSSWSPISSLIERLSVSSATAVAMPIAMPATSSAARLLRRRRLAHAMVLMRITKFPGLRFQTRNSLEVARAGLKLSGAEAEPVARDFAFEADGVAAAFDLVDLRGVEVVPAVVAD